MSGARSLGCVLMASGFGSRFGSNKLLAEAGGVPLVRRALELYRGLPFARRAIVSQYDEILILGERMGYEPIPNREAAQGISASVRLGTAALSAMDGLLFGVCDQPWLRPETPSSRSCPPSPATPAAGRSSGVTRTASVWWRSRTLGSCPTSTGRRTCADRPAHTQTQNGQSRTDLVRL